MLSTSTAGYDALCEATEPSPDFATDRAISATRHGLTRSIARTDEVDTLVCDHPLVEVLSVNNLDGAVRQCAYCGEAVALMVAVAHHPECSNVDHAEMRERGWASLTPIGRSLGLEYANCTKCGTTLARDLPVLRWWSIRRSDEIRVEYADGHQTVLHPREVDMGDVECEGVDDSLDAALAATDAAYERAA